MLMVDALWWTTANFSAPHPRCDHRLYRGCHTEMPRELKNPINIFERTIADAKESFSDRIKDYGTAVTVGVFIGSAITTGTLLGVAVFYLSQKANLLNIARKGRKIAKHIKDDDDSDDGGGDEAPGAAAPARINCGGGRIASLEARVAALERLLAEKA